jgi:hypothetical protein
MSVLSKLRTHKHSHPDTIMGNIVTTAEISGASYLAGYVQSAYSDKAHIKGAPLDVVAGTVLKLVSLGLTGTGSARQLRPHLDAIGNGFLASYFASLGCGYGYTKTGRTRVVLPAGADRSKLPAGTTVLGVDQKAPTGDVLTMADIVNLASR